MSINWTGPAASVGRRRQVRLDVLFRLMAKARRADIGARQLAATIWEWDVAGNCEKPETVEYWARADTFDTKVHVNIGHQVRSGTVILHVKCRKCERCLAKRSAMWAHRALAETMQAPRTWFGTMTYAPEEHFRHELIATKRMRAEGIDYACLTPAEQFAARVAIAGEDVTRWLKRVRKHSRGRLRYCLVVEAHESGLPHWHILMHECVQGAVTERILRGQWKHGTVRQFKLVEDAKRNVWYVCKYLGKSPMARVRASGKYGKIRSTSIAGPRGPSVIPSHSKTKQSPF